MPRPTHTEESDARAARDFLQARDGLGHLRVRRRADLLTLESGPEDDPWPRARLRRLSARQWALECATHTARWEKTGFHGTLPDLLDLLVSTFPWIVAPLE
jgi:hypothetical protein